MYSKSTQNIRKAVVNADKACSQEVTNDLNTEKADKKVHYLAT